MHVHETLHEVEQAQADTGKRPLQRLQELGLINASFVAVHMTQLTEAEIDMIAAANAHIVHCPESNLKLASGFCPVARCLAAGINVALGTDGAASNNDLDMLGEIRSAALLAKAVANDASAVPAMAALQMATLNGAKALGLDKEIGSLLIGKAADVIAIDLDCLSTQPVYDAISQIVYAANRQQVTDVWVNGTRVLKTRQLTTIDVMELKAKVVEWQSRLADR
jgi:5-methylthioadenosine/S-adenosylhomocysteine deaminase